MRRRDFIKVVSGAGVSFMARAQEAAAEMSEIYELDLRHRAAAHESIRERHDKFMQAMARHAPPWGLQGLEIPPARDVAPGDLSAVVRLRGLSPNGKMSYARYAFRSKKYLEDNARFDDYAIILFKPAAAADRLRELF